MAKHNDFGRHSEIMAQNYLMSIGYKILETNWRSGHKEIDIIAKDENIIVFVEVKSRTNDIFAKPEDAVNFKKIKNIVRAANTYLISHKIENDSRFDIITLLLMPSGEYKIEHIKDAFIAPLGI